jgi:hypothetical protein
MVFEQLTLHWLFHGLPPPQDNALIITVKYRILKVATTGLKNLLIKVQLRVVAIYGKLYSL